MSDSEVFTTADFTDSPSSHTPDALLGALGESGLLDLQADINGRVQYGEAELNRLTVRLDTIRRDLHELRADQSLIFQALQLARDKGLE